LEIRFHKHKVSFLVVKTVKCKAALLCIGHEHQNKSFASKIYLLQFWRLRREEVPIQLVFILTYMNHESTSTTY